MKRTCWTVTPLDVRPARDDGTCFYCKVPLGGEHEKQCVIRTRTVVIDVTLRIIRAVPESFDVQNIEFQLNRGSWCADNILTDLKEVVTDQRCLCDRFSATFVREATREDEERYGVPNYV